MDYVPGLLFVQFMLLVILTLSAVNDLRMEADKLAEPRQRLTLIFLCIATAISSAAIAITSTGLSMK